jgi:hypothetical protein
MYEPGVVLAAVTIRSVLVTALGGVIGVGSNVAVTPLGRPDTVNDTGPLKLPVVATVTVVVVFCPCATVTLAGARETLIVCEVPLVVLLSLHAASAMPAGVNARAAS